MVFTPWGVASGLLSVHPNNSCALHCVVVCRVPLMCAQTLLRRRWCELLFCGTLASGWYPQTFDVSAQSFFCHSIVLHAARA
jgi:hypothetical protein